MGIFRVVRDFIAGKMGYRHFTINDLLAELTPNYEILRKNNTRKKIKKNLVEDRHRYIHRTFRVGNARVENNNIAEFPNIWISYGGDITGGNAGVMTPPGVTLDEFVNRFYNASQQFKTNIIRQKRVSHPINKAISVIKKGRYNGHTHYINYQIPADLQNILNIADRFAGGGDKYISKHDEVFLLKLDTIMNFVNNFTENLVTGNILGGNNPAIQNLNLDLLVYDYTTHDPATNQPRRFNISNDKTQLFKEKLMVEGIGKKEIKKALSIKKKRSEKVIEEFGMHLEGVEGGESWYAKRNRIRAAIDAEINIYVTNPNPAPQDFTVTMDNIMGIVQDNITDIERGRIQGRFHHEHREYFEELVVNYVMGELERIDFENRFEVPDDGVETLLDRMRRKVGELADLRHDGNRSNFRRYPQGRNYPGRNALEAEFDEYVQYANSGQPANYVENLLGRAMKPGTSAGWFEKKKTSSKLVMEMLKHYKQLNDESGRVPEKSAGKLFMGYILKSAQGKRKMLDNVFKMARDTETINGAQNYAGNAQLENAARSLIGLYKLNKLLERM